MWLVNHIVGKLPTNPHLAAGLRDLIVRRLAVFEDGTVAHGSLLSILELLDRKETYKPANRQKGGESGSRPPNHLRSRTK